MIFQYNCSRCWDTGWVSNYFPLTGSPLDDGIFSSSPCDCAKGKENQLAKDAVKVEEKKTVKVAEALLTGKPFTWGVGNSTYRGVPDERKIEYWNGSQWILSGVGPGWLFSDCEYVPDPELVDFNTAYKAAKSGKVIHSVEYMRRARCNHRSELVWCTDNLKVVIDSGIIEGKWLIVEEM